MDKCRRCKSEKLILKSEYTFHDIYECHECCYLQPVRIEHCCKKPYTIIAVEHLDHTRRRLYRQCINCGGCLERNKPLSLKNYGGEIESEFSNHNFETWKKERKEESICLWNNVKNSNFETSKKGKYINYLASDIWKIKRNEILIRDKYLCQVCKEKTAEEVHHLTYENLFNEKLEDLLSVCRPCHNDLHIETSSSNNK